MSAEEAKPTHEYLSEQLMLAVKANEETHEELREVHNRAAEEIAGRDEYIAGLEAELVQAREARHRAELELAAYRDREAVAKRRSRT